MKARIRKNQYDNWYGYIGNKRVEMFFNDNNGTQEENAKRWLAERSPYETPESYAETKAVKAIVDAVYRELDGQEWDADTLQRIAEIFRTHGYTIHDSF